MARAMSATLTGAQKCLEKIKIFIFSSLNLYFALPNHCNVASTQRSHLMQSKLRQHHPALWQNVTKHSGQTLWQNKDARFPYLQDLVLWPGLPGWPLWGQISEIWSQITLAQNFRLAFWLFFGPFPGWIWLLAKVSSEHPGSCLSNHTFSFFWLIECRFSPYS